MGEHLRARRQLVNPADVGLRVTGVRGTPGLHREEAATLAGVSADCYLRLEQGRDRNPSPQVLESLARVFGLDAPATQYLLGLSGSLRPAPKSPHREVVPAGILQLLDVIGLPAFVEGSLFAVLATNRLATALSSSIRVGENRMLAMFLSQKERPLPRLGAGDHGHDCGLPHFGRHPPRRPQSRPARRRAVPAQRTLPPALGAARC